MNRFRDVKKDLIREWLDFREENNFGCVLSDEDKKHHICFEEISEVILSAVPKKDRKFVKRHWICWIIIIQIILLIGMKGIIGMGFVMLCSWLMGIVNFKVF